MSTKPTTAGRAAVATIMILASAVSGAGTAYALGGDNQTVQAPASSQSALSNNQSTSRGTQPGSTDTGTTEPSQVDNFAQGQPVPQASPDSGLLVPAVPARTTAGTGTSQSGSQAAGKDEGYTGPMSSGRVPLLGNYIPPVETTTPKPKPTEPATPSSPTTPDAGPSIPSTPDPGPSTPSAPDPQPGDGGSDNGNNTGGDNNGGGGEVAPPTPVDVPDQPTPKPDGDTTGSN